MFVSVPAAAMVLDLLPLSATPYQPLEPTAWTPLVSMTLVAVALTWIGVDRFARRDVQPARPTQGVRRREGGDGRGFPCSGDRPTGRRRAPPPSFAGPAGRSVEGSLSARVAARPVAPPRSGSPFRPGGVTGRGTRLTRTATDRDQTGVDPFDVAG
jgi:hypothetical protein